MDPALHPVLGQLDHGPDDNQGPALVRILWVLLAISTVVCAARLFVKIKISRKIFWDDVLIVIALAIGYLHAVCITSAASYGLGRHMYYIAQTPQNLADALRVGFYSLAWGFLSPMFGRLSFCVFLLWIIGEDRRIKRWPIYVFMVLQVAVNITSVAVAYAQCGKDLSILWTLSRIMEVPEKCWNPIIQTYWGYVSGSINSATDLFLTVLPAVIVSYSRLSWKSRIGVMALLCLSFLAMVASIKKTVESKVLSQWVDYTYDLVPYIIWVAVELNVVIIASSIPILRPLFKRHGMSSVMQRRVSETADEEAIGSSTSPYDKGRMRTHTSSISSQEKILPMPSRQEQFTITRTVEVSVSHGPRDRNLVHAALVGLPVD